MLNPCNYIIYNLGLSGGFGQTFLLWYLHNRKQNVFVKIGLDRNEACR